MGQTKRCKGSERAAWLGRTTELGEIMAIHLKASAFLCRIVVAVIISQVCAMSPASAQSQEFAAGLRRVEALASLKKESAVTHELSLEFMQFAGSYSNAKSLVSGLHKPSEIILVSMKTGNDTSLGVPSRNMAYGDIYRVLFVARDFVKQQKIASPNPEQIGQALNVAFLRTSSSAANGRSEDGNAPKGEKNSTTSAQPEADTKNKNPRPGNGGGQRASTESSGATAVKPSESGQSSANPPSGTSQGGSKFGSGNSNGITNGGTTGGGAKTIFGGATDGVGRDCPPSCAGAGTSQGVSGNPRGVPGETALIITPDTHGQTPLLPAMSPANGVPNASFSVTATSPVNFGYFTTINKTKRIIF